MSMSGYGEHARLFVNSLKNRTKDIDLYLVNIAWGQTGNIPNTYENKSWYENLMEKTNKYFSETNIDSTTFDLSVQITIPNEWQPLARKNIGVCAGIEVDKISPVWIEKSQIVDKIIVPSSFSKKGFEDTTYSVTDNNTGEKIDNWKCLTPIEVIPYPYKNVKSESIELNISTEFNFLTVAQWGPRKNLETTIDSFIEEFKNEENVGLIIKTNLRNNSSIDRYETYDKLNNYLELHHSNEPRKCKIYIIHGNLTESEMIGLYENERIHAVITTTHGEGFGLPLFEAAATGIPVIAPRWSGHTDFLSDESGNYLACNIEYELKPVSEDSLWPGVIEKDSIWCYVKKKSVRRKIRKVYSDYGVYKKTATKLSGLIKNKFTESRINDTIYELVKKT